MLINQFALTYLAQFILTLVMTLYLLRINNKSPTTWLFILFFNAMTAYAGVSILEATAVWSRRFYAVHLQLLMLCLALVAILQFAYRFPQSESPLADRRREAMVVLIISLLATVSATVWAIVQFAQLRPHGNPSTGTDATDIWLAAGFFWVIIVFWRRSYSLSRREAPNRSHRQHLLRPQGRPAQAAFAFVLAFLPAMVLAMLVAFWNSLPYDAVYREAITSAGVLLSLFVIAVVYFNYAPQRTSFMVKLVGISLVTLLLILGQVGIVMTPTYSLPLPADTAAAVTHRFTPQIDGSYRVTTLPLELFPGRHETEPPENAKQLPFKFTFFGRPWQEVDFRNVGVLAFGARSRWAYEYNWQPAIIATQYGSTEVTQTRFVQALPDRYVVTWEINSRSPMIAQIVLYSDGRFDLNYEGIVFAATNRFGLQDGLGGSDFVPFDPAAIYNGEQITGPGALTHLPILYRQYLDEQLRPLVYLIIIASLLIVLGFPLFFRRMLVTPLNNLVQGVTAVNEGDLRVQVPVQSQDEIGFVTTAFNRMVNSVYESDQFLETQVKERSEALITSERQVASLTERERIGRELHDDLGQIISFVSVEAQTAQNLLESKQMDQVAATLSTLTQSAQEAHRKLRQTILGIRTSLEQQPADFPELLQQYLSGLEQQYNLSVEASLPDELRTVPLGPEVETQLLRIIQEALMNVYKHAGVNTARIIFTLHSDELQVIVSDEGGGFEPAAVSGTISSARAHFGLSIMRERAKTVGGTVKVRSAPGKGTQVIARLPRPLPLLDTGETVAGSRVLLVDDHALYREGLQNLLQTREVKVVGQAENGQTAQELAAQLQPDLILMDVEMPVCDGLEATRRIKAAHPNIKIVMLTVSAEEEKLFEALRFGASGYLLKSLPGERFFSLLAEVMRGETVLSPKLAARILTSFAARSAGGKKLPVASDQTLGSDLSPPPTLTPRQREVLEQVAQERSNKDIAQALHISERTVKYHIGLILSKFQLRNRYELTQYAHRHDLLSADSDAEQND